MTSGGMIDELAIMKENPWQHRHQFTTIDPEESNS